MQAIIRRVIHGHGHVNMTIIKCGPRLKEERAARKEKKERVNNDS